jgi:hypothetical protein
MWQATERFRLRQDNFLATLLTVLFPTALLLPHFATNSYRVASSLRKSRARHALNRDEIVGVSKSQPSGDFQTWGAASLRSCKGAVFLIAELDRFLGLFYKRK